MQIRPLTAAAATAAADAAALDKAFEALKTYDWGVDRKVLQPIEQAAVASLSDDGARAALEKRLVAVLETKAPRDAKDVVCRHLRKMGTSACVPTLAALLGDEDLSHMARFALERIQAPAAGAALRGALSKVSGELRAGVAGSLGARGDHESAGALIRLLGDSDGAVVSAAATALGAIATPEAAGALAGAVGKAPAAARAAVIDGALRAAEHLAGAGKSAAAASVYKTLAAADLPEHVQAAVARGAGK